MGKKSKAKKGKKAASSSAPPDAAALSCWICLEDGPDESTGRLPVRDCACRGKSAGAHTSCLIKYAEQKCTSTYRERMVNPSFVEPFVYCPNCDQKYSNELAIEMGTALVAFVEKKYPNELPMKLMAIQMKLGQVVVFRKYSSSKVDECEPMASNAFAIIEQIKTNPRMSSIVEHARTIEADMCMLLGNLHLDGKVRSSWEKAVEHYERAQGIRDAYGLTNVASTAEARIAEAKARYEKDSGSSKDDEVRMQEFTYQKMVKQYGENSEEAIGQATSYAGALKIADRGIEAERLIRKVAARSRRVKGPDHDMTRGCESTLKVIAMRRVMVMYRGGPKPFEALRYEDSGRKCVVRGPLKIKGNHRNTDKETTFSVISILAIPEHGTPVLCHGLKSATFLNGKVGDAGKLMKGTGRREVRFEGIDEPKLVKLENLRIAFDLPEKVDT